VKSARVNGGTEDMSVSHVMPMTLFALNEMRAQSQSPSSSSSSTASSLLQDIELMRGRRYSSCNISTYYYLGEIVTLAPEIAIISRIVVP